ncbi:mCG148055 [Mus musculus]|nr:mCG148055 [Mus musculus]
MLSFFVCKVLTPWASRSAKVKSRLCDSPDPLEAGGTGQTVRPISPQDFRRGRGHWTCFDLAFLDPC